jgi:hypothetical protein
MDGSSECLLRECSGQEWERCMSGVQPTEQWSGFKKKEKSTTAKREE